LTSLT
jgi:hypothetical protein